MAPDAPLIVTNLLKYKYLKMETNYQTNSSGRKKLATLHGTDNYFWSSEEITRHVKLAPQEQGPKMWIQMFSSNQALELDQ